MKTNKQIRTVKLFGFIVIFKKETYTKTKKEVSKVSRQQKKLAILQAKAGLKNE